MQIAIYTRVSDSRNARSSSQDTANQLLELQEYCTKQGWVIYGIYEDRISGTKSSKDRVQFDRLMADASKHKFDAMLVWALDRMTREGPASAFAYLKTLRDYKVDFVSYQEPYFRTLGPAGELVIAIAAWIANQERERFLARTKAGTERYLADLAQGKAHSHSGKNLPIGRPRRVIDKLKIREQRVQGMSIRQIARIWGVGNMTIQRIVRDIPLGGQIA